MGLKPVSLSQVLGASADKLPNPETRTLRASARELGGRRAAGTSPRPGSQDPGGGEEGASLQNAAPSDGFASGRVSP